MSYSQAAKTATRIIKAKGGPAVLKSQTSGDYDTLTGGASVTSISQPCTAVVFDVEQRMIDGTNVLAGDKLAYVAALGLSAPLPGHSMTWAGKDYRIMTCKVLSPDGATQILFTLILRP